MVINVTFDHDTPIVNSYEGKPEAGSAVIKCVFNSGWPWTDVVTDKDVLIISKDKIITKKVNPSNLCFSVPMGTVCNGHNPVSFTVYGYNENGIKISAKAFIIEIYAYGYTPSSESHTFEELDARIDLLEIAVPTKITKVTDATTDDVAVLDSTGSVVDSGIAKSSLALKTGTLTSGHLIKIDSNGKLIDSGITPESKADKVSSATENDLAKLDSNGNLVDSGILSSDVAQKSGTLITDDLASIDINGKFVDSGIAKGTVAQKDGTFTNGNIVVTNSNGRFIDSGVSPSTKADKVSSATENDLAKLDSNGNLVDSGILSSDVAQKSGTLVNGNIVKVDSNGKIIDGDIAATDIAQKSGTLVSGDIASIDSNGKFTDSGIISSNVAQKTGTFTSGDVVVTDANGNFIDGSVLATDIAQKSGTLSEDNVLIANANGKVVDSEVALGDVQLIPSEAQLAGGTDYTSVIETKFIHKVSLAVEGNIAEFDDSGEIVDSGLTTTNFQNIPSAATSASGSDFTSVNDSKYAHKVSNPTEGDLAGLNASGELTDSGILATNVAQKTGTFTSGNVVVTDANGKFIDGNTDLDNLQLISSQATKVTDTDIDLIIDDELAHRPTSTTTGDIAVFTSDKDISDSGILVSNVMISSSSILKTIVDLTEKVTQ